MKNNDGFTRTEIEEIIQERAGRDPEYLRRLRADPKDIVQRQIGETLPPNLKVTLVEDSATEIFVRLPYRVREGAELENEDLELVHGGKGSQDTVHCTGTASAGAFYSKNEISLARG